MVLPLFDWTVDVVEARAAWEGFLWSPRLYPPLLIAFREQLLATPHHYAELGEYAQQLAAFLTYAALDPVDSYTAKDFRVAFAALPPDGLRESAQALVQALEAAGEQREDYWANRIQPFWQGIWPKSLSLTSNAIAESLARLSIAARGHFPAALIAVLDWLQPIEHPNFVVRRLHESRLSERFPEDALRLLDAIIGNQPWVPRELIQCLTAISRAASPLLQDHRYKRLAEYARRRSN